MNGWGWLVLIGAAAWIAWYEYQDASGGASSGSSTGALNDGIPGLENGGLLTQDQINALTTSQLAAYNKYLSVVDPQDGSSSPMGLPSGTTYPARPQATQY
jgi:hypothetical protein